MGYGEPDEFRKTEVGVGELTVIGQSSQPIIPGPRPVLLILIWFTTGAPSATLRLCCPDDGDWVVGGHEAVVVDCSNEVDCVLFDWSCA